MRMLSLLSSVIIYGILRGHWKQKNVTNRHFRTLKKNARRTQFGKRKLKSAQTSRDLSHPIDVRRGGHSRNTLEVAGRRNKGEKVRPDVNNDFIVKTKHTRAFYKTQRLQYSRSYFKATCWSNLKNSTSDIQRWKFTAPRFENWPLRARCWMIFSFFFFLLSFATKNYGSI